jgi:hypothetical protein
MPEEIEVDTDELRSRGRGGVARGAPDSPARAGEAGGAVVTGVCRMRTAGLTGVMCAWFAILASTASGAALMVQPALRTGIEMSPALQVRIMRPIEQHVAIGLEARGDLSEQAITTGYVLPVGIIGGHWLAGQQIRTYSAGPVMRLRIGPVGSGAPYVAVAVTADAERRVRIYSDGRNATDWQVHGGGATVAAGLSSPGPFGVAFEMGHHAGAGSGATGYSYIAAGVTWR